VGRAAVEHLLPHGDRVPQPRHLRRNIVLVGTTRTFSARNSSRCGMRLQSTRRENCIHSTPDWRRPRKYDPGEIRARSTSTLRTTMWSSSLAVALARKSSVPLGLTSTTSYAPSWLPIGNSKFRVFALRGTCNGSGLISGGFSPRTLARPRKSRTTTAVVCPRGLVRTKNHPAIAKMKTAAAASQI
jgi:hypothetical protein